MWITGSLLGDIIAILFFLMILGCIALLFATKGKHK